MTREGVLDTISAILAAVTTPVFEAVYRGEPLSILEPDIVAAYWYDGDVTLSESLGDVQIEERITIRGYWRAQREADTRAGIELDMWNATRAIQAGLRADSQLSGNCTDLKVQEATCGWADLGDAWFRVVTIPVHVWIFESEIIQA